MRKNRKRTKHSIFKAGSMGVVSLIMTVFLMSMVYWTVDSRCSSISREIGQAEKRLAALESEYVRVAARWDEQKTPDRLSNNLARFGLEMRYARQDQIVRMTSDGRPRSGQIAVARAHQRGREDVMAQASPAPERPAAVVTPSRGPSLPKKRTARR